MNLDNPANAYNAGQAIPALPAGSAEWLQFTYHGSTSFPRSPVTIRLLNGVTNNLSFEIYSPDRMVNGGWFNQPPVGRGTPEILSNCYEGGVNVGTCRTNDLLWTGPLGPNGTYYVRVINPTGSTVAPQLIIGGTGLAQCPSGIQSAGTATTQNQPFVQVQCSPSAPATPAP